MSADRLADLFVQVAALLSKLTPEQVDALAAGEAKLEFVPKAAQKTRAAATLTLDAAQVEADLKAFDERATATRYLNDLKLKKPALVELARALDVAVAAKDTMATIVSRIVQQKVGFRADAKAIADR